MITKPETSKTDEQQPSAPLSVRASGIEACKNIINTQETVSAQSVHYALKLYSSLLTDETRVARQRAKVLPK